MFKYSDFMFFFTKNFIVAQIMVILSGLTAILNVMKGSYRLKFSDLEKKYKKKGKKDKK